MTMAQAEAAAQRFLDEYATSLPDDRRTLRRALDDFIAHSERQRKLRASTLAEYRRIANWLCARPWRTELTWRDRPLDTFAAEDLLQLRAEMVDVGRDASTVNHVRRVIRGAFGTHSSSPALTWPWMSSKVESEGQLRFYDPEQIARLKARTHRARRRRLHARRRGRAASERDPRAQGSATSTSRAGCCGSRTAIRRRAATRATRVAVFARCR